MHAYCVEIVSQLWTKKECACILLLAWYTINSTKHFWRTEVRFTTSIQSLESFGVVGGVIFPEKDKTTCKVSCKLRLLTLQTVFVKSL